MDSLNKYNLMNICNLKYLQNVAIEHHCSFNNSFCITYLSIRKIQRALKKILYNIELSSSQFIGISSNIPIFCIPTLILSIISSGRAFVYLSEESQYSLLKDTHLNIQYVFSSKNLFKTIDNKVIRRFVMHKQSIILLKVLKSDAHYQEQIDSQKINDNTNVFAYAITTSGSTGVPSIVRVTHASIVINILDLKRIFKLTSIDKIAHLTPLTFDPSIVEIFLSMSSGATMLTVSDRIKNNPYELLMLLHKNNTTFVSSTPSLLLHRWSISDLNSTLLGRNSSVRVFLLGGEPFPSPRLIMKMKHRENQTHIFNIYGITEVSCWASINEISFNNDNDDNDNDDEVIMKYNNLGTVLDDTIFQVRSEDSNEIINEGKGLLYVGSITRICAIDNETIFNLIPPIFRNTGDIVTIDKNNKIIFNGRQDSCVKKFGQKIYLNKLECHVNKLNFVKDCHTIFNQDSFKIHLFFTIMDNKKKSSNDEGQFIDDIWIHVRELPTIMTPDHIHYLEEFKITEHGKICKNTLKKLSNIREYHNDVGNFFESIWRNHLSVRTDGKTSRFVDAGGTSIIALEILGKLTNNSNNEFPQLIGMLLENKTLNECRNYVVNQHKIIRTSSTESVYQYEINDFRMEQFIDDENVCQWQKCRGKTINYYSAALLEPLLLKTNYTLSSTSCQKFNSDSYVKNISLKNIKLLHLHDLTKCVDASPTVFKYISSSDIFVSVGSHSGVICTVQISNNYIWRVKLPDRIEASILIIDNFKGVVGCHDGFIYCIHLLTGEIYWKFQTFNIVKCLAVMCSKRQKIFFGSYDRFIYCISIKDGSFVWKQCTASTCATPLIHNDTSSVIFVSLDGNCISLDQITGKFRWKSQFISPIFSSPTFLNNNKIVIVSDVNGNIVALMAHNGEKLWKINVSEHVFADLVTINKNIYNEFNDALMIATKNGNVYRYDFDQDFKYPKLTYKINCKFPIFACPWIEKTFVLIVQENGELISFNSTDGTHISTFKLYGECFSSPVLHENLIFVGSRDNNLCILAIENFK